jgi:hypothetical protein
MRFQTLFLGAVTVLLAGFLFLPETVDRLPSRENAGPREVGTVRWGRDYDAVLKTSKSSGKPIFVLFQEVPG